MLSRNLSRIIFILLLVLTGLAPLQLTNAQEETTPEHFLLRFTDAYLIYSPGSGKMGIYTNKTVLSYGGDWEVRQLKSYLYHLRQQNWGAYFWEVNTSRREVYRVTGGTFGQLGGQELVQRTPFIKFIYGGELC